MVDIVVFASLPNSPNEVTLSLLIYFQENEYPISYKKGKGGRFYLGRPRKLRSNWTATQPEIRNALAFGSVTLSR